MKLYVKTVFEYQREETERFQNVIIIDKFLVGSLSELSKRKEDEYFIIDNTLPVWNSNAFLAISGLGFSDFDFVAGFELMAGELKSLPGDKMIVPVYGHVPLMHTKNCIKNTRSSCNKTREIIYMTDRMGMKIPVLSNCDSCENIIYNSLPLSLHNSLKRKDFPKCKGILLSFTKESREEVFKILSFFSDILIGNEGYLPYKDFTAGHFKKPVL